MLQRLVGQSRCEIWSVQNWWITVRFPIAQCCRLHDWSLLGMSGTPSLSFTKQNDELVGVLKARALNSQTWKLLQLLSYQGSESRVNILYVGSNLLPNRYGYLIVWLASHCAILIMRFVLIQSESWCPIFTGCCKTLSNRDYAQATMFSMTKFTEWAKTTFRPFRICIQKLFQRIGTVEWDPPTTELHPEASSWPNWQNTLKAKTSHIASW